MDFLDPKKKRNNVIKLYIGYGLMAILIGISAVILLYAAFGYGVNKEGEVYQNSTVFLASEPDGANATIKNESTGDIKSITTNDRMILPQGNYTFNLNKSGYRPWTKSVELRGGQISRLDYVFLFPKKLVPSDIVSYASKPGLLTTSPDRNKLMVQRPNSFTKFDLFDNNNLKDPPKLIELSSNLFSGMDDSGKLTLVEWSNDNRHVLIKYNSRSGNKFVLFDTKNPTSSININTKYTKNFTDVRLRDKSPENFYLLTVGGTLFTGTLENTSLQKVLDNVGEYQPYKNDLILFINTKNQSKNNAVKVQLWDAGKGSVTIKELPKSSDYYIDLAEYDGDLYAVVGASSGKDEAYIFRDPLSSAVNTGDPAYFVRTLRLNDIKQLSFSKNARFICIQSGANFDVYDAEDDRQYKFEINKKYKVVDHQWMDNHRLIVNSTGNVVEFDFDGTNVNELLDSINNDEISFNRDFTSMSGMVYDSAKSLYKLRNFDLQVK
jgi:hypothetical protein